MKSLIAAALLLTATTAFATERVPGTAQGKPAYASPKQNQLQQQSQAQSQAQAQQQILANSTIATSNGSVTVGGDNHKASAFAPSLGGFASGPCVGTGMQGTFGVVGFGAGLGVSTLDDSCTRRETARVLHMMGQQDLALKVMLTDPIVQKVLAPQQITPAPQQVSSYCSRNPSDYYCKQ